MSDDEKVVRGMRVAWEEFYEPRHPEDFEDWQPTPQTKYHGEVINAVRAWGETRLVVMLDSGQVREVKVEMVKRI